jgi:hypothetical protein
MQMLNHGITTGGCSCSSGRSIYERSHSREIATTWALASTCRPTCSSSASSPSPRWLPGHELLRGRGPGARGRVPKQPFGRRPGHSGRHAGSRLHASPPAETGLGPAKLRGQVCGFEPKGMDLPDSTGGLCLLYRPGSDLDAEGHGSVHRQPAQRVHGQDHDHRGARRAPV